MPWGEEPETRPLNIKIVDHHSDVKTVSVNPYAPPAAPNGKIVGIRIQDVERQIWFNYDNGVWDAPPEITVGSTFYAALWVENIGGTGTLTPAIKDDTGVVKRLEAMTVYAGEGAGIEAPYLVMPNRVYGLIFSVTP